MLAFSGPRGQLPFRHRHPSAPSRSGVATFPQCRRGRFRGLLLWSSVCNTLPTLLSWGHPPYVVHLCACALQVLPVPPSALGDAFQGLGLSQLQEPRGLGTVYVGQPLGTQGPTNGLSNHHTPLSAPVAGRQQLAGDGERAAPQQQQAAPWNRVVTTCGHGAANNTSLASAQVPQQLKKQRPAASAASMIPAAPDAQMDDDTADTAAAALWPAPAAGAEEGGLVPGVRLAQPTD